MRKTKKRKQLFFQTNQFREVKEEKKDVQMAERIKQLHAAISNLNKVERAIILLHLDNVSNAEIAEIVGITQNYVRVRMNRIKAKLSKVLKGN